MDSFIQTRVPNSIRAAIVDLESTLVDSTEGGDLAIDPTRYFRIPGVDVFLQRAHEYFGIRRTALYTNAGMSAAQWAYSFPLEEPEALRQSPWFCRANKLELREFAIEVATIRSRFDVSFDFRKIMLVDDNPRVVLNALFLGFGFVLWITKDTESLYRLMEDYSEQHQEQLNQAIEDNLGIVSCLDQVFFETPKSP